MTIDFTKLPRTIVHVAAGTVTGRVRAVAAHDRARGSEQPAAARQGDPGNMEAQTAPDARLFAGVFRHLSRPRGVQLDQAGRLHGFLCANRHEDAWRRSTSSRWSSFPEINQDVWQPNDWAEWQNVIYQLVRRYSVEKPIVTHWEHANEADYGWWGGCPFRFGSLEESHEFYRMLIKPCWKHSQKRRWAALPGNGEGSTGVRGAMCTTWHAARLCHLSWVHQRLGGIPAHGERTRKGAGHISWCQARTDDGRVEHGLSATVRRYRGPGGAVDSRGLRSAVSRGDGHAGPARGHGRENHADHVGDAAGLVVLLSAVGQLHVSRGIQHVLYAAGGANGHVPALERKAAPLRIVQRKRQGTAAVLRLFNAGTNGR